MAAKENDPLMFEMKRGDVIVDLEVKEIEALEVSVPAGTSEALCQAGCLVDPQLTAKTALEAKQIRLFRDAVTDERVDVNHEYITKEGVPKTLLTLAIEQWSKDGIDTDFVVVLIANGAKLDKVDPTSETAPIHAILRKASPALLNAVLKTGKTFNINVQDGEGLTPLHVAVEQLEDADEAVTHDLTEIIRTLLRTPDIEINCEDNRGGLTPLYYSAAASNQTVVQLLMENGADADIAEAKEMIAENLADFDVAAFADKVKKRPSKQRAFAAVELDDVNGLKRIAFSDKSFDWNSDNGAMTLLQFACHKGNGRVVEFLLRMEQIEPNLTIGAEGRTPLLIAAHHGFFAIIDLMKRIPRVRFDCVHETSGKSVLHEVFRADSAKNMFGEVNSKASYAKCLKILLSSSYPSHVDFEKQIDRVMNYRESLDGNTALHYATMQADQELVKLLLRRGANMGVKNFRDKTPVQSILPSTLEEFLNDYCVKGDGIITDEMYKVTFRYDFLAPPILGREMETDDDADDSKRALPETEALWYLSTTSKQHRSLLKHPVIASFLWLKWQRIRTFYYVNLLLYVLFVSLLTTYIFLRYGGLNDSKEQKSDSGGLKFLAVVIALLLIVLLIREIFQMLVSFKRYFFSPENLMELSIIVLSFVILFDEDSSVEMRRHLAAVVILFSWTETLVLIGRHPKLSTNVTMFTTVVSTFFRFLLWYGIIVLAFAIAFFLMFHDENYEFFDRVWIAFVKTSAMFVGELEFSDIPFTSNAISYAIFLAFIFLVVVVLMNLLNGLAVSDTGLIREEAEVVGWSSRVELITYTESMLLGDPFYFLSNWPAFKLLQRIPSCAVCRFLYRYPSVREALQKISGGTKILLFYSCLPKKTATFYPNRRSPKALLSYKRSLKVDDGDDDGESRQRQKLAISNDVLDAAKELLIAKMKAQSEEEDRRQQAEQVSERLLALEEQQLQIVQMLKQLTEKH